MALDLAQIPYFTDVRRGYQLTHTETLLYGAIVVYHRHGLRPTHRDLAYTLCIDGCNTKGGDCLFLRNLRALKRCGLILVEPSRGSLPARYTPVPLSRAKGPPCAPVGDGDTVEAMLPAH